jgi:amidohydrolase
MPGRTELLARLLAALDGELAAAEALRERLHACPELAYEEHATAAAVLEALDASRVARVGGGTGILAALGPDRGGAVALRAELDGLRQTERTGAPFAAPAGTMHGCGHDIHMAALVALFRAARTLEPELPVPLVALFQPSEENYPSGALRLVEEGALDGIATVAAAHVHPDVAPGAVTADDGPVNASSDNFRVVVDGHAGHAAYPHVTRDPVVVLAEIIVAAQTLVSRTVDPLHSAVLSITQLAAGTGAENVVPDEAVAGGTLRALHPDDRAALKRRLAELVEHTGRAHGCRARLEITSGEPAIVNDPALTGAARPLLAAAGCAAAAPMRSCGSDDFGFFGASAHLLLLFAGFETERRVPLHHPEFLPARGTVATVARALACAYVAGAAAADGPGAGVTASSSTA